jgi:hypothetical protein
MREELTKGDGVTTTESGEGQDKPSGRLGRRALMLSAAAGVGATAAMVAGADPASATEDRAVLAGESNTATSTTEVITSSGSGLYGVAGSPSGAPATAGVFGDSNTVAGAVGASSGSDGVQGMTTHNGSAGVYGEAGAASGITWSSAGVHGDSNIGVGVFGGSSATDGVHGVTTCLACAGVFGIDESVDIGTGGGAGVTGESLNPLGVGVFAANYSSSLATALQVEGVAAFSRSGIKSIAAGKTSVTVAGLALSAASLVLANLQTNFAGVWVQSVVPDDTAGQFKIHLSKAVPAGETVKVAWFVVN